MSELCMGSYQRHYYRLGAPVREIVRRGQDTLYRLKLGRERQHIADMIETAYGGANWRQSLGELCIELAQELILVPFCKLTPDGAGVMTGKYYYPHVRRDIQELREKMYHKHTDPEKERQAARAERLIELVRVT